MNDPEVGAEPVDHGVPQAPGEVPPSTEPASILLEDVQQDDELSLYIASADRVMDAMGYTEHGFRHANLVAKIAYQVLARLAQGSLAQKRGNPAATIAPLGSIPPFGC